MSQINLEITTKCNFDCYYCYRKNYNNENISFKKFKEIIDPYLLNPNTSFKFVGEGEPLLHPLFWDFISYINKKDKHNIILFSNGSTITQSNIEKIILHNIKLTISIDSLSRLESEMVGRHRIDLVLNNIININNQYKNIELRATNYGQSLLELKDFAKKHNIKISIVDLYKKDDYASVYPIKIDQVIYPPEINSIKCTYIERHFDDIRFNIEGIKTPCCFIKDYSTYPGYDELIYQLKNNKEIPPSCRGCRFLQVK